MISRFQAVGIDAGASAKKLSRLVFLAMVALSGFVSIFPTAAAPAANWTIGIKKVLIIPVRFTDQGGPSDVPGPGGYLSGWGNVTNGTALAAITNFYATQSYGKCNFEFTALPE